MQCKDSEVEERNLYLTEGFIGYNTIMEGPGSHTEIPQLSEHRVNLPARVVDRLFFMQDSFGYIDDWRKRT